MLRAWGQFECSDYTSMNPVLQVEPHKNQVSDRGGDRTGYLFSYYSLAAPLTNDTAKGCYCWKSKTPHPFLSFGWVPKPPWGINSISSSHDFSKCWLPNKETISLLPFSLVFPLKSELCMLIVFLSFCVLFFQTLLHFLCLLITFSFDGPMRLIFVFKGGGQNFVSWEKCMVGIVTVGHRIQKQSLPGENKLLFMWWRHRKLGHLVWGEPS